MGDYNSKARIPTRPLDKLNEDQALPKELIVDYEKHELYVTDEAGEIHQVTSAGGGVLVQNYEVPVKSGEDNWTATDGNAPYIQEITVYGITEADYPIVDVILSANFDVASEELENYAYIYKINTSADKITIYATKPTAVDLTLVIKVSRTSGGAATAHLEADVLGGTAAWEVSDDGTYYTQNVALEGITEDDAPIIDVQLSDDYEEASATLEDYSKIYKITTGANVLTVYATEPTEATLTLIVKTTI